jgi:hypothetical protein
LSELLDGIHHPVLLCKESVSKFLRPLEPVIQHLQDGGERYQRFHARVPVLLLQGSRKPVPRQVRVRLHPAGGLNDLKGIGNRHQDLCQEIIGIERDGRKHLVQLLLSESRLSAGVLALHHDPSGRRGQQQCQ